MLQNYFSRPHGSDASNIQYNHENDTEDIPDGLDPLGGVQVV